MQYRLVLPNHACDGNMFCTGGSICVLGVCKCPSGMYSTSGVLICRHQPISLIHADTILTIVHLHRLCCVVVFLGAECWVWVTSVQRKCTCPVSKATKTDKICDCYHYHFARSLIGQPGYLRKTVVAQGKRNWQPLKDCPVTPSCLLPNCFCSSNTMSFQ
ncbi:unnamed protein product [Brugia timori]|uniref:EB domain-containing protein n=1 Tax=Brugia timori TaxID=42155 RepID=A0A0R3Q6X7_9BILA|nr:unnamed protein product [Brugia timori]